MRKTMKLALFAICMMMGMPADAQSVLDNLTFEAPLKMIRPTGNNVNVREQPSANGKKVGTASRTMLFPVLEENAQWYRIGGNDPLFYSDDNDNGWVNKSVAKVEPATPISPDMMDRFFGWCESYDWANEWMISQLTGKHELALMITPFNLYLGKQVGDVFVFKYGVPFYVSYDSSSDPKTCKLSKELVNDELQCQLIVGKNYMRDTVHGNVSYESINLTKLSEKLIESIFSDAILNNRVEYIYVTASHLSAPYAKYEIG